MQYEISNQFVFKPNYNINHCVITIGYKNINRANKLTDDELITNTSESLTHEHIHYILFKLFGYETSALFDTIGDGLRNDINLLRKICYEKKPKTINDLHAYDEVLHSDKINIIGIKVFLYDRRITSFDIFQANNICNNRQRLIHEQL